MIDWSAIAIQEALIAFENYEGEPNERMEAALNAAADAQGLNGRKKRAYKKERMSSTAMVKDQQLEVYRRIVREELEYYDLTWDMLIFGGQIRPVVDCRWMIIYRVRKETGMSYPSLAKLLELDHSTCVNAFQRMLETDGEYYLRKPLSVDKLRENRRRLKFMDAELARKLAA